MVSLYPNPSDDEVKVRLTTGNEEVITSVLVLNLQGVTITGKDGLSSTYEIIRIKEIGAGVYLIKVIINIERYELRKVLIQ